MAKKVEAKAVRVKSIAEKVALHTHTSIKSAMKSFNYYRTILKNQNICGELKLNEEEMDYIKYLE